MYFTLQLSRWWQQTQGEICCFWVTEYNHRRLLSRSGVASRMPHGRITFAGFRFFSIFFPPYLMICLACAKPHPEVTLDAVRSVKQHSSWILLLSQRDICWDQPQLVPAARDLKPLPLVRRDLRRSPANNHLLLIPCRHQSPNADPHRARAHSYSLWPLLRGVHRHSLLGLSERNYYRTWVSTCHWALL